MLRPQRAFQVRVYRVESQGAQFGIEMSGRGRFSMVGGLIESVLSLTERASDMADLGEAGGIGPAT
jgi:hypothetical protein